VDLFDTAVIMLSSSLPLTEFHCGQNIGK